MFGFKVFEIRGRHEEIGAMDYINRTTKTIYDEERTRAISELENDLQKVIYLDWWYGGKLWEWNEEKKDHDIVKRYRHVSKYDFEKARGQIFQTISNGMG